VDVSNVDPKRAKAIVITGAELKDMSEKELDEALAHPEIVFARTSPQQKLRVVEGCQRQGHIVAVTGDGVNDSPALKTANIGVAMGITGSEVSKEAALMILLDDNFASIVMGIEQGRTIFDNLKKSISYKLTANLPCIMPFVLFVLGNVPQILPIVLVLAIDVGTDMWPAIALAYELPEADIMTRPPRDLKKDKLVNAKLIGFSYLLIGIIQILAGIFTFHVVMGDGGQYNGGMYAVTGPFGNGFPPSSLWGLGDQFLANTTNVYTICRICENCQPKQLVGCRYNMAELDSITPGINHSKGLNYSNGGDFTGLIPEVFVDYCFDDPHWSNDDAPRGTSANGFTCRLSNTIPRDLLHNAGHSGYFISVILCQWACLYISKTRWSSIFQQGIHNTPLVLGWVFENVLALFLIYVPGVNTVFLTFPLQPLWYLPPLPFAIAVFAFDEIRKAIMRSHPHGWVVRHTYY